MSEEKITYQSAGVDTEKGQKFVASIREKVASTFSKNVLGGLGGFSAAYDVSFLKQYKQPVLLSCTDGVGTKLELARLLDKHDTIGIDLVAMCVNDLVVNGGKPMFFLDYISCGRLEIEKMNEIVKGITDGCRMADTSLVGGETAEHPGVMKADEYDMAGFCVGAVEKELLIDGKHVGAGDIVLGLESSGLHSNGFSLIRKLLLKDGKLPAAREDVDFIREHVMTPTRIYVKSVLDTIAEVAVKGMVHITGGGYYENIPRILADTLAVKILKKNLPALYVYEKLLKDHHLDQRDMFATFNMGTGYVVIVSAADADAALSLLRKNGEKPFIMGEVVPRTDDQVFFVE